MLGLFHLMLVLSVVRVNWAWLSRTPVFDVGAGTAGSLIAHRLATETNYTFVLLEAGGRGNFLLDIPVVGPLLHGSVFDWLYETVPQENACLAMINNKCKLPQGKIVGGSSKLNNMLHVRGNISHYVDWFHGKLTEKFIRQQFEFVENNLLHLNEINYESELAGAVIEAAKELGYENIGNEFDKGFSKSKVSQNKGKRWSTSDNLSTSRHIITNAFVERIITNKDVAIGVDAYVCGEKIKIYARNGIILSAGTYNTPKILQLSGIGPSKLLKPLGIKILKDLPVGENLQDHIATGLDLVMYSNIFSMSPYDMLNPVNIYRYFSRGEGPLTTPGCEVIGFVSTENGTIPDLQFMVLPVGISSDRGSHLRKSLGMKDEVWYNYFAKTFDKHTATMLPIILHPKSKGVVYINSTGPTVPPCVNPKYFSNVNDVITLIKGLKLLKEIIETKAMKSSGAYMNPLPFPGCEIHVIFSDAYWECYIRHLTLTSYHPVGTCSMGLPESSTSVVDTSFRVIGINKLYVTDGSVLPTLPSGNINAAITMMASVFFEIHFKPNIKPKSSKVCHKYDLFYEYLYDVCILNHHDDI